MAASERNSLHGGNYRRENGWIAEVSCGRRMASENVPWKTLECATLRSGPPRSSTMAGVYFLYSATLALLLTLTLPWWLVQMLRLGKYRAGLGERLGMVPARIRLSAADAAARRPVAWIHAVSVGEVLAIAPMVALLQRQALAGRRYRVVVSTTTHTGQRLARDKFGATNVFYFPLDLGLCIRPYLRALRPELVILAETEFWPNFLRLARASGARLAVVNARISDRSFPRYLRFRGLLRQGAGAGGALSGAERGDAERLRAVGAAAERVEVSGNLKFDAAPPVESAVGDAVGRAVARLGRADSGGGQHGGGRRGVRAGGVPDGSGGVSGGFAGAGAAAQGAL